MWIVKIALKAPYTFTVLAILLLIGGALTTLQMPKDIFPAINIPVVGIIWTFNGMPAQELERRITTVSERALTTTVNNIEHIESNSFNGINVIKVYLQPGASVDAAIAEASAAVYSSSPRLLEHRQLRIWSRDYGKAARRVGPRQPRAFDLKWARSVVSSRPAWPRYVFAQWTRLANVAACRLAKAVGVLLPST